jgi:hypothetical protein
MFLPGLGLALMMRTVICTFCRNQLSFLIDHSAEATLEFSCVLALRSFRVAGSLASNAPFPMRFMRDPLVNECLPVSLR